ncbi:MAG: exopolysaccharide biosynthesis protein [Pseudomonadota bacterium]
MLVLALPCAVPFLYGVPQVMSLPLLFVSGQLVAGRRTPWLPEKLARREVSVASLREIHRRAEPWLRRVEVILRPRLQLLSRPPLDRLVGVVLVICSLSIMVPLPLTNTTPGIAVALIALGFLERDGLVIAGASALGLAWVSFLLYLAIFIPAKLFGAA